MLMKIIIIGVIFVILGSLISGLFFLVKDKGKSKRTVKALTWRIAISLSLFICLFLAFKFNLITPHAI